MKIKKKTYLWGLISFGVFCLMAGLLVLIVSHNGLEEANASSGLSGKAVLFDGDSIAAGSAALSTSGSPRWSYANYLEEAYGINKTNIAVGGARFYWPNANADCTDGTNDCHIIPNHITSEIKGTDYDYIILEGAINDLHNNYYAGNTSSYATELRKYFNTITTNPRWKDAKIGFVIVPHPNYSVRTSYRPEEDAVFWRSVQNICNEYSIEYINFNKLKTNDDFVVPSGFDWNIMDTVVTDANSVGTFDGLHPSKGAHGVLGEYIAKWMVNLPNYKYTVSFDDNGSSISNVASQTIVHGKTASQPTYTIDGDQHFVHWSNTRNGTAYDFNSKINNNITLYAVWNASVVFDMNGGKLNGQTTKTVSVNGGSSLANPGRPVKDGFVFKHWATDSACKTQYDFSSSVTRDLTLYACYNPVYTLTFDANGGTATTATLSCEVISGEYCTIKIPFGSAVRGDDYLIGYGGSKGSDEAEYEVGGSVKMDGNKTIYAIWEDGSVEQRESDKEYIVGDGVDMVITINYPLANFVGLKLDNVEIDNSKGDKYALNSGSTVITVFSSYIDTLEPGEHVFQAEYDNGVTREAEFVVKEKPAEEAPAENDSASAVTPNTGKNTVFKESVNVVLPYTVPGVIIGVVVLACRRFFGKGRRCKFD